MGGKASRDKGRRAEYILRDYFRMLGWYAERVPLSGASPAMKGDVIIKKGDKQYFIECKARKDQFKLMYAMYNDYVRTQRDDLLAVCLPTEKFLCVQISTSFDGAMTKADHYPMLKSHPMYDKYKKTLQSLIKMYNWLGESDVLVIKNDHQPFLFIRYL